MLIGQTVGPFTVEKELGSGAMGTVYKAKFQKDENTTIPVAIKIISMGLLGNEGAMARFDREAAILKQLKHPHIVRLLAVGKYRQTPFIAMEYVDGESLDRVLARRVKLPWEDVLRYGIQLCEALQHAHDKGIVHRDLKPSNLMVTREGILKLTDFGIAKDTDVTALTGANSTIGTAAYMSPEQCRGDKTLGPKSDLYSLGICFYELITGKKPFTSESTVDMFLKHVNEEAVRPRKLMPDLPIWLDNLIMFMMEKNKENRPLDAATVGRMLKDIEDKVQSQQSVGVEIANARRADRPVGENPIEGVDKDAAKLLRSGDKKKKKKKPKPLHKKPWVKAAVLGTLLVAVVGVGGFFLLGNIFKSESAEQAFNRVENAPAAGKLEAVEEYLKAHGTKSDPAVEKARAIFREEMARVAEKALDKRYHTKMKSSEGFDEEGYALAFQAFEAEGKGNTKQAVELWSSIKEKQPQADNAKLPAEAEVLKARLGWVAEKRLKDLQQFAPSAMKKLATEIEDERRNESYRPTEAGKPESLALTAQRLENFGDKTKARLAWERLYKLTERDLDQRPWAIIAAERLAKLTEAKDKEQDAADRVVRVNKLIDELEARAKAVDSHDNPAFEKRTIRNLCRDITILYNDETAEAWKQLLPKAAKLLESLPK